MTRWLARRASWRSKTWMSMKPPRSQIQHAEFPQTAPIDEIRSRQCPCFGTWVSGTRRIDDLVGYKQGHKALFYPGSGSRRIIPYVLLVWIDFDGVVTMARSQSLRESNRNGEVCVARVFFGISTLASPWPYIDGRVSSASPFRNTIVSLLPYGPPVTKFDC